MINGFILSGGGDHSSRYSLESQITDYAVLKKLPLLGVCHGMLFLTEYFGGALQAIEGHVACEHLIHIKPNHWGFTEGTQRVNSYHRYTTGTIPKDFRSFAFDENQHCEAMEHMHLPIVACMWHPERDHTLSPWFKPFLHSFFQAQS